MSLTRSFPLLASAGVVVASVFLVACTSGDGAGAARSVGDGGGSLGTPTAVFPEDFGTIQTIRELADGRVLVADPLGGALFVVDMDAGTRTVIGTEGQGPGEYRQPDAVWPLPGDSTLLVDLGNGRLIALGPDLSFGETSPLSAESTFARRAVDDKPVENRIHPGDFFHGAIDFGRIPDGFHDPLKTDAIIQTTDDERAEMEIAP